MNVVFLGPPGAGKGTIGELCAEKNAFFHVSTGDLLRSEIKKESDLGYKIKGLIDSGNFIPDEMILDILESRLEERNFEHIILDGYPRNLKQGQTLESRMEIDYVVNFVLGKKEIVQRLIGRRHCFDCGQSYNIHTIPSKKEGICDSCQGRLVQRDDDKEEIIRKRLNIYKFKTKPLVYFYKEKGILA